MGSEEVARPRSSQLRLRGSLMKRSILAGLASAGLLAGGAAQAEVPAGISTAIATMQADGVTVATAFVVAAIAVAAIKFLRSAR